MTQKIYVACLASYNNGLHYGQWITLDNKTVENIEGEIQNMLSGSSQPNAEEWEIHDFEDIPSNFGKTPDLDAIVQYVEACNEYGEDVVNAAEACFGADYAVEALKSGAYHGEYRNERAFAEHFAEDVGIENETLIRYFDYDSFARDLFIDDFVFENGHVFAKNW